MVKEYDKDKIVKGTLKFDTNLYVFNEKKSSALISCPFPAIKLLGINEESELEVLVKKKKDKSKDEE